MFNKTRFLIPALSTLIYGIAWAAVYLIFAALHGMDKMFNDDFVFLIAKLFNISLKNIEKGVLFSFLDGALFGLLVGYLLLRIYKKQNIL